MASSAIDRDVRERALGKAARRLVPFLALLYFVSFLDRVNVGFAALTMNADIGLSASAFGLGAGIFFIGYILLAVPSNLALQRFGAARWIATITVLWGAISLCMAFVQTPMQFYVLRFLLGAAESGFFPGVILYLSIWFPDETRGRIIGGFFMAAPLSNLVGAPLSGWLMGIELGGLAGWQTMFIVEALPAIALGLMTPFRLTDTPARANWLTAEERDALSRPVPDAEDGRASVRAGLVDPRIWAFGLLYFLIVLSLYGFGFFAPQILRELGGLTTFQTGWVTAIPYLGAVLFMAAWTRHSDHTGERSWHVAIPTIVGGIGFLAAAAASDLLVAVPVLTVAAAGIYAACPIFWTLPTRLLGGMAAASGIALINSVGNLAGYVGPAAIGVIRDASGGYGGGLTMLAAGMIAAGILALLLRPRPAPPQDPTAGG